MKRVQESPLEHNRAALIIMPDWHARAPTVDTQRQGDCLATVVADPGRAHCCYKQTEPYLPLGPQ